MDLAKLKALKVADLRAVLTKAAITVPAKATKNDLIARIQAHPEAHAAFASIYPPADDLLAPPEEVDWNADQPEVTTTTTSPAPPAEVVVPPPTAPQTDATATAITEAAAPVDPELEKRKQRAARFGIPLVEPKQPKKPKPTKATAPAPTPTATSDEKKARAARFGLAVQDKPAERTGRKRAAPQSEEVDPEELERRKKRAERFANSNKA